MKHILKKLFVIPLLALTSCGGSSISSTDSTTSEETKYYWNEKVDSDLRQTIGDYISYLPVFTECKSAVSVNEESDGIEYTLIDCVTELSQTMSKMVYKTQLVDAGFQLTNIDNGAMAAFKSVSTEYSLIAQFGSYEDHINIIAYLFKDKSQSWPSEYAIEVLGEDIPHYEANWYTGQVAIQSGVKLFQIVCYEVPANCIDEYYMTLKNAGYITRSNDSYYNAVHNTKLINLDFLYDNDEHVLVIQGYKLDSASVWPEATIKNKFGFELPVYVDPAVTYLSGYENFQVFDGGEDYHVVSLYTVQCEYAPRSCLSSYDASLKEAGWEIDDDDLPDEWPMFICSEGYFNRYKMTDEKGEHSIEVRYYTPEDPVQSVYGNLPYPIMVIIIYC